MTTIEAKVPDYLARLTGPRYPNAKGERESNCCVPLSAQVESWRIRDDMEIRAHRANPAIAGQGAQRASRAQAMSCESIF